MEWYIITGRCGHQIVLFGTLTKQDKASPPSENYIFASPCHQHTLSFETFDDAVQQLKCWFKVPYVLNRVSHTKAYSLQY